MIDCIVIKWDNVNNKDYNDPSSYTVVNWHYIVENLPVQGLDLDLEVLVKRTPFNIPAYDSRLVLLSVNQQPVDEADDEHPTNKKWVTTYELLERSGDEKKVSVEEAELENNLGVFPTKKQLKYLLLYTAITRREALGLNISPEQQLILDKGDLLAEKVWFNHVEAISKKEAIDSGQEIDLDENWENEEA